MIKRKIENSPIIYYINSDKHSEWVLFLHAAFVNHNMFKSQVEYFKDKYNVMTLDILGHGESIDTQKGDSIEKMSLWMKEILDNENIQKIHIVGVSLGSVIAQDFANKYPGYVQSLSCFGGYDINNFDEQMQKENGAAQMGMMLKALVSVKWFSKANMKISAFTQKAQQDFYEMNIKFPKKSFMYLASLNKLVNVCEPQRREYPLLIGCGEHDIPMELEAVKMWEKTEDNCSVIVFKDAGHCVNMDTPESFNKELEEFWTM